MLSRKPRTITMVIFSTRFECVFHEFLTRFECIFHIFSTRFECIFHIFSTRFECSFTAILAQFGPSFSNTHGQCLVPCNESKDGVDGILVCHVNYTRNEWRRWEDYTRNEWRRCENHTRNEWRRYKINRLARVKFCTAGGSGWPTLSPKVTKAQWTRVKLAVVLDYQKAMETYSRIGLPFR